MQVSNQFEIALCHALIKRKFNGGVHISASLKDGEGLVCNRNGGGRDSKIPLILSIFILVPS